MSSRAFVVVTGPDRSPQPMETVDGAFTVVPLLAPRGPSRTQQTGAFPRLRRLLFFLRRLSSLISAFLTALVFITFLLFKFRKAGDFFGEPPPFLRPRDCLMSL